MAHINNRSSSARLIILNYVIRLGEHFGMIIYAEQRVLDSNILVPISLPSITRGEILRAEARYQLMLHCSRCIEPGIRSKSTNRRCRDYTLFYRLTHVQASKLSFYAVLSLVCFPRNVARENLLPILCSDENNFAANQ